MESVDPVFLVSMMVCLLFSLTIHEAAHAVAGTRLGDDLPELDGRVTLNPIPHIDLFGTIVLPLLLLVYGNGFLFGWAKPVRIDPSNLKNERRDMLLIALAGPASNVAIALVVVFGTRIVTTFTGIEVLTEEVIRFLYLMVALNVVLAVFNMMPIPPLDGHRLLPIEWQERLAAYGPILLIVLILVLFQPISEYLISPMLNVLVSIMFRA